MTTKLSILDQSPVMAGLGARRAIEETLALAKRADELGYHRYWLAEHHAIAALADPCPEILLARLGAETRRIRVGTGGVLLPYYSAFRTAETFRMLEALYPGRIDLGIGRAPGSDQRTARALRYGPGGVPLEHFPQQLADLIGFLHDELPAGHPFQGVRAMPAGPTAPPLWILGSSGDGAALAAHFGTAFSFAHFINAVGGVEATQAYREAFRPSARLAAPQASVAVFAVCADTAEEAERLARCRDLFIVRLYTGRFGPFPSVEEAEAYPYSAPELAIVAEARRRTVSGTPDAVKRELEALAEAYGVEELIVVTITHDFKKRLRSYELLAEAFGLF